MHQDNDRGSRASRPLFHRLLIASPLLLVVGVFFITSWLLAGAFQADNAALLYAGVTAVPETIDLGVLTQGEVVKLRFTIVNHTPNEVKLLRIDPACDCTKVPLPSAKIAPGESAVLEASWDVESSRGRSSTGLWVTYIEDGERNPSQLLLTAVADVAPDIQCEPKELTFSEGQSETAFVRLSPGRSPTFQLLSASSATSALIVTVLDDHRTISVRFDPERWAPSTRSSDRSSISIRTDSQHDSVIHVPTHIVSSSVGRTEEL